MGNTPQHPPQRRTLDSWSKPHSSPPNWKAERDWRGGGGREGSPVSSRPAWKPRKDRNASLQPGLPWSFRQIPGLTSLPAPHLQPPAILTCPSPQGQAFSHLRIFPHTPHCSFHLGHCGALTPESYFPSGVSSDPPQRAEVHPLGDLTAPFASPPQVVLLFISGPSHFCYPVSFLKEGTMSVLLTLVFPVLGTEPGN